jgi:hypothetical protein
VIGLTFASGSVEKQSMLMLPRHARSLCVALLALVLAPEPARAGAGFSAPDGCTTPELAGLSTRGFPRVLPLTYLCPFEPRTDCVGTSAAGDAKLLLKQVNDDRTRDRVRWRMARGPAIAPADLGDPTAGTGYELCVYVETAGVCTLAVHPEALAGSGWRARRNGFEYVAPRSGNPTGMRRIRLRSGAAGKSSAFMRGRGDLLGLDALPLSPGAAVLVQLHNDTGACWSAEFGLTPAAQTDRRFLDRND